MLRDIPSSYLLRKLHWPNIFMVKNIQCKEKKKKFSLPSGRCRLLVCTKFMRPFSLLPICTQKSQRSAWDLSLRWWAALTLSFYLKNLTAFMYNFCFNNHYGHDIHVTVLSNTNHSTIILVSCKAGKH